MGQKSSDICDQCGKSPEEFINSRAYKYHFKAKDHSQGGFSCSQCKQEFNNNVKLKTHRTRIHIEKKLPVQTFTIYK